jgi:signal peptide peptidase SppA
VADTTIPAVFPEQVWAGSDLTLSQAATFYSQVQAGMFDKYEQPDEEQPYNYSLQGDVAVISIKGALINTDSWYNRYRDVSSYADVRRAMIYAANDQRAKAILMDIDSGGGAVSGLFDTAELIGKIDKGLKPVYGFTSGTMASAAYALGVSGRAVYNSKTALLGSIGTIMTHMEDSKMLKDLGIGVTVLRSGAFKALANSHEPLTDEAKAQLQKRLDGMTSVFENHVAAQLKTTQALVHERMGQGREFLGEEAVTVGLSHGLMSFDDLMSKLAQQLDNNSSHLNNSVNFPRGSVMNHALTEQQIAALAAAGLPVAAGQPAATTQAAPAVTQSAGANDGVLTYLQGQLTASQETVASLRVQLAQATSERDTLKAQVDPLKKIAAGSLDSMRVALNLPKLNTEAMSPETLLADHGTTAEAYGKAFPVGGVASASASTEQAKPAVKVITAQEAAQRALITPKL